jgi:hypothetical protein
MKGACNSQDRQRKGLVTSKKHQFGLVTNRKGLKISSLGLQYNQAHRGHANQCRGKFLAELRRQPNALATGRKGVRFQFGMGIGQHLLPCTGRGHVQ